MKLPVLLILACTFAVAACQPQVSRPPCPPGKVCVAWGNSAEPGTLDPQKATMIDEFAITTRYSAQTGRPEPMVTVGKRITDRVRLSAATGLTGEERTFQTGLEWRVGDQTSIQASYDNLNRESASSFGNLGVDFRWRLEFE